MDLRVKRILHIIGVLLFVSITCFSCGETKETVTNADPLNMRDSLQQADSIHHLDSLKMDIEYYNYSNITLPEDFTDTLWHVFSDTAAPDRFTLFVPKGNIYKTRSVFRIVNAKGELLYEDVFDTYGLVNGYEPVHNEKEAQLYLQKRREEFLAAENFIGLNPVKEDVILQYLETDENGSEFDNYPVFLSAQQEFRPLFVYYLHEESISYIGYSPKTKKAVLVLSCC